MEEEIGIVSHPHNAHVAPETRQCISCSRHLHQHSKVSRVTCPNDDFGLIFNIIFIYFLSGTTENFSLVMQKVACSVGLLLIVQVHVLHVLIVD